MKKKLNEKKFLRAALLSEAEKALEAGNKEGYDAKMGEVKSLNTEIESLEALDLEKGRFADEDIEKVSAFEAKQNADKDAAIADQVDVVRSSNEYARAFAFAIKNGLTPEKGVGNEKLNPLFAALKTTGGTPEGSDGGFLVPVDIDNQIRELRRGMLDLSPLVQVENVQTMTGWRVKDTTPTKGFTKLGGELTAIPEDDQPKFAKVDYSLDTYGLFVPMSKELLSDEVANLLSYLARWFAKKGVLTENKIILDLLAALVATDLVAGKELAGIKTVLNKTLDPAISIGSKIIANQSAFDILDQVEDTNKRPLLQPNPVDETMFRVKGRDVFVASDAQLANVTTKSPIYIGDFAQYLTLFRRQPLEVNSTDIGGNAWRNYGVEVRGIMRLDAAVFDADAVKALTVTTTAG